MHDRAEKPLIQWPSAVHEYELKPDENIEDVEERLRATGESYNIWHPGTLRKGTPARFYSGDMKKPA